MATVSGSITPGFSFLQSPSNLIISGTPVPIPLTLSLNLQNGILANQIDLIYAARLTYVASTAQTFDLTALTDVLGGAVNFARVAVYASKMGGLTDGMTLTTGNAATNAWAGFLSAAGTITQAAASAANPDGSWFIITAPNTTGMVTGGSSKSLKLLPSAHVFTSDLIIAGRSV